LSGGERQRLAIARSLYREAKIFLFDEATNALDSENEIKIFELINKLKSDKIIFLISHSKEALNYSDKVVKIQDRKIIFE
jgi:subfamily B ATP-binding cassette protein MsbA